MKVELITLKTREAVTICIVGGFACLLTGAAIAAALIAGLHAAQAKKTDDDVMTSERAKGMMMKISASPARCQQWQARAKRIVCE